MAFDTSSGGWQGQGGGEAATALEAGAATAQAAEGGRRWLIVANATIFLLIPEDTFVDADNPILECPSLAISRGQ